MQPPRQTKLVRTEAQWRARLGDLGYRVMRQHGTEPAGTHDDFPEGVPGRYLCAGCDAPLFDAATKYDSGTGWPSFWAPLDGAVRTQEDRSLLMRRTEVHCATCLGHLGHVFPDGPQPTGLRYCMNGVALRFVPER